tara:strand:+ start:26 stop:379 length:354 start_codon:yes stop_codon:yes gene_type:complete
MLNFNNPIIQFIVGGSILSGGAYLANNVNPFFAGLLAAFPLDLLMLFAIKDRKKRREYSKGLILFGTAIITAATTFYFIEPTNYINSSSEIIVAFIAWCIVSTMAYIFYFRKKKLKS